MMKEDRLDSFFKMQKSPHGLFYLREPIHNYARSTNPDFKQEVHTYIFFGAPFTRTLTDFTFDFHILFDLL